MSGVLFNANAVASGGHWSLKRSFIFLVDVPQHVGKSLMAE